MQNVRVRTYVWEFPVRFTHWINVLCIIALSITGLYIGGPYMHSIHTTQYKMGWMKFIHFTAAWVFVMMMVIRIYWSILGNRYASWSVLLPLKGRQWRDAWETAKFYAFVTRKPPYSVGHTALAAIFYLLIFLSFIWEIFTGFALYSQVIHGFFTAILGGWLKYLMHIQMIRFWHHFFMWVIWAFTLAHVYIGWYLDSKERNGIMGSIFGGYKFVTGKEWE